MGKLMRLLLISLTLMSCLQPASDDLKKTKNSTGNLVILNNDGSISFSGATSISNITDNSAQIHWGHKNGVDSYLIVSYASPTSTNYTVLGAIGAPFNSFEINDLNIDSIYYLSVIANSNQYNIENLANKVVFTTLNSPIAATNIEKVSPIEEQGQINQIQLRIHGTKPGDTVYVYTDSVCTTSVGDSISPSGSFTDVTTSALALGTFQFYAKIKNALNNYSSCSSAYASYRVSECPFNYVKFSPNPALGTNDLFCVAKYEMKCSNEQSGESCLTGMASSKASSKPWTNITQAEAKIACTNLGAGYHLITNAEWMTMAREIELKSNNWSNGVISIYEKLNRGHSFNQPDQIVEAYPTDDFPCFNMLETSDILVSNDVCSQNIWHEKRRTFVNTNNEIIWDISGNVWEWVDYENANDKPTPANTWSEFNNLTPSVTFPTTAFKPSNTDLIAVLNNIGIGYANSNGNDAFMKRGGNIDHGIAAGIYAFTLRDQTDTKNLQIGFRCTYTP